MRLAIATENGEVSSHFGHCEKFIIVDIENGILKSKEEVSSFHNDCGSLPQFLGEKGVQCIIAGGIGARPKQLFNTQGIQVIPGITGSVEDVVTAYIKGNLHPGENLCSGHHEEGECRNH